jgi:hypothetical protein
MRYALLVTALCLAAPAGAQTVYQYKPTGTAQYGLAVTSVQTLTVPNQARIAEICVDTAAIRYTTSGTTPSASVGMAVASGACFQIAGRDALIAIQIIGSGATVDVEYFQ